MTYESWRISYQSSEAAARAAYNTVEKLHEENQALRKYVDGLQTALGAQVRFSVEELEKQGMRLVNAGALQMVVNALRRDAEEGKQVRGEMADELLTAMHPQAQQAPTATDAGNPVSESDAPVGLPEPDAVISEVMELVKSYTKQAMNYYGFDNGESTADSMNSAWVAIQIKLRALLATGGQAQAAKLLAADHSGMKVNYRGLFSQVQRALKRTDPGYSEMLRQLEGHLQELGQRWYAGDTDVVDEFLQLYCIECDARKTVSASATEAPQAQAAASTTDQSRVQFDAWIRTHEDEHGAVDEASALAAWTACSLMQVTNTTMHGLEQFIEQVGDVHFQRCRVGSKEGAIRWDIEFGHYGAEVRGKTLREAITKSIATQAKQEGAA